MYIFHAFKTSICEEEVDSLAILKSINDGFYMPLRTRKNKSYYFEHKASDNKERLFLTGVCWFAQYINRTILWRIKKSINNLS